MFPKPSRRWFQFSIRSLLILMTVLSVVVGRVTYLQRQVAFHEEEAKRINAKIARDFEIFKERQDAEARERNFYISALVIFGGSREEQERLEVHRYLARQYRRAIYRPWTTVNESPTLEELYADP